MSEIIEGLYQDAKHLHDLGFISDVKFSEFEKLRAPKVPDFTPPMIKTLRERFELTQHALAALMNVSPSAVQKWEIGDKHPDGASRKLLSILDTKGISALL
ncbi:MAG: helix-turn-helix domain-containing protein [Pyramidobacter sp.]|nr:helix-turn-helix domain-containing protein [Pyramidobacter sp.]MBR1895323.1 helix-turn-helix domain-containing protein [Pyramidobacter sp.]